MSNTTTSAHRWLIVIAVMLAASIEVLDMTIVNVAMPQMMGTLQTDANQITWVLTSYIVSSAIVMLLTGLLVNVIGRKRLLLINIAGFLITSILCGLSQTLSQIVLFRTLQGIFGASLIPLSQYILRDTFPREQQGMAMAIWACGIMAAPVLGPTLGGYITDALNWRWVFYINIPVCLISFLIATRVITETPRHPFQEDWRNILFMALAVGSLQLILDRGNTEGWFDSPIILLLTFICVFASAIFIYRSIVMPNSIIDFRILRNRNFTISTLILMVFGIGIFGTIAVQPLMLEYLFHYPVMTTGELMAPRGIASAITMIIAGKLMQKHDPRLLVILGVLISAYGSWLMVNTNLNSSYEVMLSAMIWQGIGMGLFFVPLSTIAMSSLPQEFVATATGLFSFGRSLGSAIGISVLSTVLTREAQVNWNQLSGHIDSTSRNLQLWLQHTQLQLQDPTSITLLAKQIHEQSQMLAFIDAFWLASASFLVMLPLVFALEKVSSKPNTLIH